jgi:hypothetical protein
METDDAILDFVIPWRLEDRASVARLRAILSEHGDSVEHVKHWIRREPCKEVLWIRRWFLGSSYDVDPEEPVGKTLDDLQYANTCEMLSLYQSALVLVGLLGAQRKDPVFFPRLFRWLWIDRSIEMPSFAEYDARGRMEPGHLRNCMDFFKQVFVFGDTQLMRDFLNHKRAPGQWNCLVWPLEFYPEKAPSSFAYDDSAQLEGVGRREGDGWAMADVVEENVPDDDTRQVWYSQCLWQASYHGNVSRVERYIDRIVTDMIDDFYDKWTGPCDASIGLLQHATNIFTYGGARYRVPMVYSFIEGIRQGHAHVALAFIRRYPSFVDPYTLALAVATRQRLLVRALLDLGCRIDPDKARHLLADADKRVRPEARPAVRIDTLVQWLNTEEVWHRRRHTVLWSVGMLEERTTVRKKRERENV